MQRGNAGVHLSAVLIAAAPAAFAQSYPVKPVRIIVPFAAGGGSDTVARLIAPEMARVLGQQVIVENRTGANGIIGADAVAKAAPDGYTLLVTEIVGLTIRPSLIRSVPYDPAKDFTGVAMVAYGANVLVAHPSLPVRTTKELIALARARPGELNFSVPGFGSGAHLAGVELEQLARVRWAYIPYKGGAPAIQELVGGQVDFGVNSMFSSFPHVKAGRLRLLAVASGQRHPQLPEVPTLAETIPGHESGSRQGILGPAGLVREIAATWNAEIGRLNASPVMRDRLMAFGASPETMTTAELQRFLVTEKERWARVVQTAGIKGEP
jgi:tripartite-type tricarboxylate transporter receptor subunit TctC